MWRRILIWLASVLFLGVMVGSAAEARMGHMGGGFHGGFGGTHFARGGHFAPGARGFHPGFAHFHHFHNVHHRRFALAVPFVVGAPYYYGDPCWVVRYTPWGIRRIYVCDGYY